MTRVSGGKTSAIAAVVLVTINFIAMFTCLLFFALFLWIIASPTTLTAVIQTSGTPAMKVLLPREVLSVSLGVGVAVAATIMFVVSFMGLYGACGRSQFLLFMYSTLVLLFLLLECSLLFYFATSLSEKGIQEKDGQLAHALRLAFQCCEHNVTSPEMTLPWSCCGVTGYPNNCTSAIIYNKDCKKTIQAWLSRYQTAIYASLSVLHIVLSSCSLLTRRRRASHSYS